MENLFDRKSTLAKLLAQENLTVEHRNVPTAYFDLESRTIVLPNYREMDSETYDLMTGHEVGHAFYTPADGWHSAVENNKSLKSYLNVIEDARIERKIKEKYPGLRRSFGLAYKKLHDQDFFGLAGIDVKRLNLIDRINIFYKLGAHVRVGFTPEELTYIDRINVAQTWEDVRQIATELHARAKEERKKQREEKKNNPESSEQDDELEDLLNEDSNGYEYEDSDGDEESNFGDSDDFEDFDDSEEEEKSSGEDSDEDNLSEDSDETDDEEESEGETLGDGSEDSELDEISDEDVESLTDRAFRQNEQNLIDGSLHSKTVFVPKFNSNTVVPYKIVHGAIKAHLAKFLEKSVVSSAGYQYDGVEHDVAKLIQSNRIDAYRDFVHRSTPMVNYMVKEFEMRKNAAHLSRAKVSKSGEVDVGKLARYSLGADIFKRVTTVKQGKNHGLVLFVDLSGSMQDILLKTFEQTIALTMFCKKVNIPFEVYGFSNNPVAPEAYKNMIYGLRKNTPAKDYLAFNDASFHLKHYLSNNMPQNEYREACMNMIYVGKSNTSVSYFLREHCIPDSEILHGTPLDEAVASSIEIVNNFKTSNRLDIVNCIFLTDGEGGVTDQYYINEFGKTDHAGIYRGSKSSFYIQYPGTNIRVRYENKCKSTRNPDDRFMSTRALIEVAKKVTGAKYTGYYICSKNSITHLVYPYEYTDPRTRYSNSTKEYEIYKEQMKTLRNKLNEGSFLSSNKFGFDEYFFVVNDNLDIKDEKIVVPDSATKSKLTRAFIASVKNRNIQRMFLNRFMQNIAA